MRRTGLVVSILGIAAGVLWIIPSSEAGDVLPSAVTVEDLQLEHAKNPSGIDILLPRFSWVLKSDVCGQKQNSGETNLWDSGKVIFDQPAYILYAGQRLKSYEEYLWKIKFRHLSF